MTSASSAALDIPAWRAELDLRCAPDRHGCTSLVHNRHSGPLQVQRLLYPEGPQTAHAVLLHPPGGIAGSDQLDVQVEVDAGAHLLCTTPGAGKWYHGERGEASQQLRLAVQADGALEWLPQESILYDGARARMQTTIDLAPEARMFGWDIVQLGRVAAGERYERGRWRQLLSLRRRGRECWREQLDLDATDALLQSPLGLAGHPVCATAWACAPNLDAQIDDLLAELRACAAQHAPRCGISWVPAPVQVLQIRALGHASDLVRALLEDLWATLRPTLIGRPARRPRIWST